MKPESFLVLKMAPQGDADLEDWVTFKGPVVMLIPVLEKVLEGLRATAGMGYPSRVVSKGWPFGACGAYLIGGTETMGPCVNDAGHLPEPHGPDECARIVHRDASGTSWAEEVR